MSIKVQIKKCAHFDEAFPLPRYETSGAAGLDLRASLLPEYRAHGLVIPPGQRIMIPTALRVAVAMGYEMQIRPRSGLSLKSNLLVVNSPGTVDSDYRGEIKILMGNFGTEPYIIHHGDRVAQAVLQKVEQVVWEEIDADTELSETVRGDQGFGHTGLHHANPKGGKDQGLNIF